MYRIAHLLGGPISLDRRRSTELQRLTVRPREQARPNSLSSRFGTGPFPLHTDGASWATPPRYLILGAATATYTSAATVICQVPILTRDAADRVCDGVFVIRHGANSFFGSISRTGRRYTRYDPACMRPIDEMSHSALALFSSLVAAQPRHLIKWRTGDVLVIDNWRTLHGRGPSIDSDGLRVLLRLYAEPS